MLTKLYDWKWFLGILKSDVFDTSPMHWTLKDRVECFKIAFMDLVFFRMEEFHKRKNKRGD